MPTSRSTRQFWFDHFCAGDRSVIADFVALNAQACLPLLEVLGLPRADGVDYESAENRVFGFGDVVLKLFRPGRWSLAALQDEVIFLNDLLDAGLDVVRPIGNPGTWQGVHYQLYSRINQPFKLDPEVLTPDALRQYVHLVARLHQVGAQRAAPHRPRLDPIETCAGLLDVVRHEGFIPKDYVDRYTELIGRLAARLAQTTAGVPMQRIHNDPGSWNVLWRPQGPLLMDLDDFDIGPVAIDLAIMHSPWRLSTLSRSDSRTERLNAQRALILSYYREIAPFPEEWEAMFEPLQTLRGLFFDAWFSSRWRDPGFSQHYPRDNITDQAWWHRQLDTLTQRLES